MGFYPLLLNELNYSPVLIGSVSLAATAGTIIGANFSQFIARSWGKQRVIGVTSATLGFISLFILIKVSSELAIVVVSFLSFFFLKSSGTLVDSVSTRASFENSIRFERVRLWGSIGFIVMGVIAGILIDSYNSFIILILALIIVAPLPLLSLVIINSNSINIVKVVDARIEAISWRFSYNLFLTSVALLWGSHALLEGYHSVYLESLGWSAGQIAVAYAIGVISEILIMWNFYRLEKKYSLYFLYLISAVVTILRWIILGLTTDMTIIYLTQFFHAFSFGLFYISAVKITYLVLPEEIKDSGQGWLAAYGMGLGMLLGKLVLILIVSEIDDYKKLQSLYLYIAGIALLGLLMFILAFRFFNKTIGFLQPISKGSKVNS